MNDPNEVLSEATEGTPIAIKGTRLWKVVTVLGSGDDMWLVLGLCSGCICC